MNALSAWTPRFLCCMGRKTGLCRSSLLSGCSKLAPEPKRMVRFPLGGHVNLDDYGAEKEVRVFLSELRPPGD